MANFTTTKNTRTITQNAEWSIANDAAFSSGAAKTTTGYVGARIDLTALLPDDDVVQIRQYHAVDGGTLTALAADTVSTPQIYRIPIFLVGSGWDITVTLISATPRAVPFEVVQDTNDVNASTAGVAAVAAVADAIFGFVLEAAPANATTFWERLNVLWSILVAKATYTGLTIPTPITEVFRDAADTKTRAAFAIGTNGVRALTSADGRP